MLYFYMVRKNRKASRRSDSANDTIQRKDAELEHPHQASGNPYELSP